MTREWSGDWEDKGSSTQSPYIDWSETIEGEQPGIREGNVRSQTISTRFFDSQRSGFDFGTALQAFDFISNEFLDFNALISSSDGGNVVNASSFSFNTSPGFPFAGKAPSNDGPPSFILKNLRTDGMVPEFTLNPDYDETDDLIPDGLERLDIPDDGVIVGVIDTGIALGHHRLRTSDGKHSRVLAAWQQSADRSEFSDLAGDPEPYLPFGREYLGTEIDALIRVHTHGSHFDEEAFNRATGSVTYTRSEGGHRELDRRASHGAHVLDAAAGFDALTGSGAERALADKTRIIAVNLPDRATVGLSGRFLEYFVIHGILRIVDLSYALWRAKYPDWTPDAPDSGKDFSGYPIVINLSFGKQAGSKDGDDLISNILNTLNTQLAAAHMAPVILVVPAGNDNLNRGNALVSLAPDGQDKSTATLHWRTSAEDQSANYIELWSTPVTGSISEGQNVPLAISVESPEGQTFALSQGVPGRVRDLVHDGKVVARIYCHIKEDRDTRPSTGTRHGSDTSGSGETEYAVRYTICTAPSQLYEADAVPAPSGIWKIRLENRSDKQINVLLGVQTDQSEQPEGKSGLLSYFDHEDYQRHAKDGRLRDSYSYNTGFGKKVENLDHGKERLPGKPFFVRDRYVRQHGTLNAVADALSTTKKKEGDIYLPGSVSVGGYRASDGKPALFSSTGSAKSFGGKTARGAPAFSLPVDDGPAHLGVLGAGARDGSVVAMRGTSFATAQATRMIAKYQLEFGRDPSEEKVKSYFYRIALAAEMPVQIAHGLYPGRLLAKGVVPDFPAPTDIEKVGTGRLKPEPGLRPDQAGSRTRVRQNE